MKYIKVTNEMYVDESTAILINGGWQPARPMLLVPTLIDRVRHLFKGHFSYGQKFCVMCGRSER